jgi:hypothetical protein
MKAFKRNALRVAAATVASGMLATGAVALAGAASASTLSTSTLSASTAASYRFETLDNQHDVTFNQLLGINNEGVIAGYFGSGAAGHPNKGYQLLPPYGQGNYVNENFTGSVQTQVTGLNNRGVTVGFWSNTNMGVGMDANFAWVHVNGQFRTADFPTKNPASPATDQLLGVNDSDIAVGFWVDGNGNNHGYEYNINNGHYSSVVDPHDKGASLQATAINDRGDIAGNIGSDGFLLTRGGQFITLAARGASSTMALGVNDSDEVVGTYTVGSGSSAVMHGFTWTPQHGFTTVDDPHGVGTTTVNGVNDHGQLVGFYVDSAGNTDGFLATP